MLQVGVAATLAGVALHCATKDKGAQELVREQRFFLFFDMRGIGRCRPWRRPWQDVMSQNTALFGKLAPQQTKVNSAKTRCHCKRRGSENSTFLAIFWGFWIFSAAPVL